MDIKIGDFLIGKVINVKPYALFLQFENGKQGLLHISEISDAYIRDIEKFGSIGDELKVKVLNIDSINGFMRLSLKQVPENERYSSHSNEGRAIPILPENNFKDLEANLPKWISETLKKAKGEKND